MRCPFCGHGDTYVKDSRSLDDQSAIRRRRHCQECKARFSTVEHVQLVPLKVVKRDESIESFDRSKLLRSIEIALHKRPTPHEKIERIINSLIRQLEVSGETHIPSTMIGQRVMEALVDLDPVAYIRFASVYEKFHEPQDFQRFLMNIPPASQEES